tara:strand:- start:31073 stop:32119 length:1047 start_codon:yes stop_codon:yes gene_type:complete
MVNTLVTGGLGYIGSHTCIKLIENGFNVYILDSLHNSSYKVFENLSYIRNSTKNCRVGSLDFFCGDIRNYECIENIFNYSKNRNQPIDMVLHFAGLKSISESNLYPEKYWDINYEGTKVLLDVMDKNGCSTIIFSSSATVYGDAGSGIINEDFKIKPNNVYGKTKAKVEELLLKKYKSSKNWNIINLRYFNPIGAHKSGLIGDNSSKEFNNLFPLLCKSANNELDFIRIFGKDWDTRDGTCIRDFIHVVDIAKGHLSAVDFILNKKNIFLSINLGTAKGTTVLELVKIFEEATQKKINYIFVERRIGDVGSYIASNKLAKEKLNWSPQLSILAMCIDGWKWYLKNNIN